MHRLLVWVSGFGDAALLLPTSLFLLAYFLYRRSPAGASAWMIALAMCLITTLVGKISFHACGAAVPLLGVRSPSGHVSFSATFYLSASAAAASDRPAWLRRLITGASLLVVSAIAVSRVMLHVHTPAEVMLGGAIGTVSAAWFVANFRRKWEIVPDWRILAGVVASLALLTHGWHLDVEKFVAALAREIGSRIPACAAPVGVPV